ncbi:PKD domain-containing protein [Candidatus Reidiella endopervernicosa]|uniref:PKD domain-containing protein n=1 Tax=Candidatus Reidiella endopervernicosa TaxID=2738883 RepID=A0A6N0HWT9_9GAMM|nr:PKD domain-containing protein [Candidatus Reidiella endopervernicosa]QKQ26859.1 hypothetical protein HUE57_11645 [Candidatus Reidiella endopervernicosa]
MLVEQGGADVVVTATVTDPNPADTHSYDWSGTDNGLTDTDGAGNSTFTFTPATAGTYILQVTATDSGNLTNSAELTLNVVATMPVLTATDSDGDGVDDDVEGAGDSDGDGIPDYLDNANLQGNVLQEMALTEDRYIVETEPGLILTLGSVALRAGEGKAGVSEEEIVSHGNDGAGAVADGEHSYTGGLFDFTVDGLPVAGQSVTIVVPQHAAVPANAVYRKQQSGGWFNFVEDANNTLASALGEEGFCPPPGDAAYSAGLNEGDWCVQLIIEDGGANDADGLANNRVVDPGGVSVMSSTASSSGSGAVQPLWLLLLSSFAVSRVLVQRRGRDKL